MSTESTASRPPNLEIVQTRHGRRVVYFRKGKGPRIRLPDDLSSPEFAAAYEAAKLPIKNVRKCHGDKTRKQRTEAVVRRALRSARVRARRKNVPFDLDLDFLLALAEEQDFRCKLTGINFFARNNIKARIDPYTPSIDRIVPALGYVKGNVRIVIFAVNAMLLDWGEPLFIWIANSYRFWERNKTIKNSPAPFLPPHPEEKHLTKASG